MYLPSEFNWEEHVKSEEFDRECAVQLKKARERAASDPDNDDGSDYEDSSADTSSSVDRSPHEVSRLERHFYYAGLGPNGRGPKLIYRTSDDKFVDLKGPKADKRLMKLCPVPEDHELGHPGRWDRIRDEVRVALSRCGLYCETDIRS